MPDVKVETSAEGLPVALVINGARWVVGAEPVRWFERVSWWETKSRMSIRDEGSRIDVEAWQLQVYPAAGNPEDLSTFEIVLDAGTWSVRQPG